MAPLPHLDPGSSIKHWIAYDLRFFRELKDLTLDQVAAEIGSTKAAVSNYEHARPGWNLQTHHAIKLDAFFQLPEHFVRLVKLAKDRETEDWFAEHLGLEAKAEEIHHYELGVVPGLLQHETYAKSVLTEFGSSNVEAQAKNRLSRQEILRKPNPPLFWALLDQAVLSRVVGGQEVIKAQLEKLLEVSKWPNVSLRVVPHSTGWHPGLSSSFRLLEVEGRTYAYTETTGGGKLWTSAADVKPYSIRFRRIGAKALPEETTRGLILAILEGLT